MEGFFDDTWEVFLIKDEEAVLDDRQCHSEEIGFLERGLTDKFLVHLPRDGNQGNAIHISIGDAGHQVRCSRATGRHANTGFTLCACITVCHKAAALFHAGQNGADLRALGQGLVQLHRCATGIGKHHVHSLALKRGDQDISTLHFGANFVLFEEVDCFVGFHYTVVFALCS